MDKELTFKEALRALKGMHGEYSYMSIEEATHNYEGLETKLCEWLQNHPLKTRKQDFLEKFPNALLYETGIPVSCCKNLGITESCCGICDECWNEEIDEEEKV